MKRRMREEKQHNKIFESPDKGKTVYERNFGNDERTKIKYWVSGIMHVDHVLRTQTHILFVQTIEEATVIEEIEYDKKKQMDNI